MRKTSRLSCEGLLKSIWIIIYPIFILELLNPLYFYYVGIGDFSEIRSYSRWADLLSTTILVGMYSLIHFITLCITPYCREEIICSDCSKWISRKETSGLLILISVLCHGIGTPLLYFMADQYPFGLFSFLAGLCIWTIFILVLLLLTVIYRQVAPNAILPHELPTMWINYRKNRSQRRLENLPIMQIITIYHNGHTYLHLLPHHIFQKVLIYSGFNYSMKIIEGLVQNHY